jgi:Family of unknown function (DUF5681)
MSETSNPTHGEPLEARCNELKQPNGTPAEEYKVGPGRPPPNKRWKKGGPSPNPRGRPRREQSMAPDVRKAFEQAMNKKVPVPRGDKKVLMSRVEIGLEQLLNQFAKGDRHARRDLMEFADRLGIDFLAKHRQAVEEALAPTHQEILDAFVARRNGAGVRSAPRVLAPPELLDDDLAEPEPTSPSPPKAAPESEPEPPQKPGMKYPKPFSRMTRSEKLAWYPEWYEENKP